MSACIHIKLLAFVARLEKDFGEKFVALLSDLIRGTIFPVPISITQNLDCPREDSSENSLCNNVFYTGIIFLCTHNRFNTGENAFGLMFRHRDFIEVGSCGGTLVWKMRFSNF